MKYKTTKFAKLVTCWKSQVYVCVCVFVYAQNDRKEKTLTNKNLVWRLIVILCVSCIGGVESKMKESA